MAMEISLTSAESQYKQNIAELASKYGGHSQIPSDKLREVSETLRLHHILHKYQGKVTKQILSQYMIPESIIEKVNPDFEGFEPKVKRADKYDAVYKWLDANSGTTIATQEFADIAELSYPTTLKFIDNNPQYFRKVKRGKYEVRNPHEERKADK